MGSFVTRKLCEAGFEVHLFDINPRDTPATFHHADAATADHSAADLIVNMVPGEIGHEVLRHLNDHNHRIVDLSFSETTPDQLPAGSSTVLWDVGIAPGLSNMLVAHAQRELGPLDSVSIKVGETPAKQRTHVVLHGTVFSSRCHRRIHAPCKDCQGWKTRRRACHVRPSRC